MIFLQKDYELVLKKKRTPSLVLIYLWNGHKIYILKLSHALTITCLLDIVHSIVSLSISSPFQS